jgi:hypothetical protein
MNTALLFYVDNCGLAGSDRKLRQDFVFNSPNGREPSEQVNANEKIILKCLSEMQIFICL